MNIEVMVVNKHYTELEQFIDGIKIVDTHEHLSQEPERLTQKVDLLATFFPHYASSDLRSAGMSEEDLVRIRNPETSLDERWLIFEPWWEKIRNTGYARSLEIAARDLYEVDGISAVTYQELSDKIKQRNKKGLYDWVLKKSSGIDVSVNDSIVYDVDKTFFRPVRRFSEFLYIRDRKGLETLGKQVGGSIHTFRKMEKALESEFMKTDGKIVGIKIGLAYTRPIHFEKTSFADAEKVFNQLYKIGSFKFNETPRGYTTDPLDTDEYQLMQDYLVHKIIQEATKRNLPIQIHTGLQEGNENIVSNSHPGLLTNLFMEYKDTRFDVFHGGWPYSDDLGAIAKNFPNVYIDMCWMHIISPSRSQTALSHWLDEVPANKILGFGGDYLFVEGVYGHSVIARRNITEVLASKVSDGIYTLEEAKKYAQWIF